MKYYFCALLITTILNGMDAPFDPMGSPLASQWHSAPNSPTQRRYNRDQLLAIGKDVLARKQGCSIGISEIQQKSDTIKKESNNWRQDSKFLSKSCDSTEVKGTATIDHKKIVAPRKIRIMRKNTSS